MIGKNTFGFSIIEIMIALVISSLLFLLLAGTTGVNILGPFLPSKLPSPQLRMLSEKVANRACYKGPQMSKCFNEPDRCYTTLRITSLNCFMDVKDAIPPILSIQEEDYLLKITADCIRKKFQAKLDQHPEYLNKTCTQYL